MLIDPDKTEQTEQVYRIPLENGKFVRTQFVGYRLESPSKQLIQNITRELNKLEEAGALKQESWGGQISADVFDIPDSKDKTNPKVTLYGLLSVAVEFRADDIGQQIRFPADNYIEKFLKIDPILHLANFFKKNVLRRS